MGIRDALKKREEKREAAANGGNEFPEGVTRYVKLGKHGEVNSEGKTFVMLADPDDWYFYFVHEDSAFDGKRTVHAFRKHTCLHNPKEPAGDGIIDYEKPDKDVCISCKAGAKRKLYAMIPVYDPEYKTYRVIDTKEYHVNNLILDYDKAEKMGRKFNAEYTLVGEAVHIKQVDKTYALEGAVLEELFKGAPPEAVKKAVSEILEDAKKFIGMDFDYEELANFREESDIVELLRDADDKAIDKSVLPDEVTSEDGGDDNEEQFDF